MCWLYRSSVPLARIRFAPRLLPGQRCCCFIAQSHNSTRSVADSASEMRYSESNRATARVCCGGAGGGVMFFIRYGSVYLKLNVGKWVASVTTTLSLL